MTEALCYVAIGDSSTAGTGETFVRWTDLLTTALRAGGLDFTCHNLAVYGVKCTEVAETQLEPALELNPDLLSVLCGINDVLMSPAPDIERYECVLDGMFTRARDVCGGLTLMTATIPDLSRYVPYRPRGRARVSDGFRRINLATRRVAAEHDAVCVELAAADALSPRSSFGADGYHPSADGHQRMARAFLRALGERWRSQAAV